MVFSEFEGGLDHKGGIFVRKLQMAPYYRTTSILEKNAAREPLERLQTLYFQRSVKLVTYGIGPRQNTKSRWPMSSEVKIVHARASYVILNLLLKDFRNSHYRGHKVLEIGAI